MAATQDAFYLDEEGFTLGDLVDLALCTPEVGAVNFNILRILLHEVIRKLNLEDVLADVTENEKANIQAFNDYLQGQGSASPFGSGVIRFPNPGQNHIPGLTGPLYVKNPSKPMVHSQASRPFQRQAPNQPPPPPPPPLGAGPRPPGPGPQQQAPNATVQVRPPPPQPPYPTAPGQRPMAPNQQQQQPMAPGQQYQPRPPAPLQQQQQPRGPQPGVQPQPQYNNNNLQPQNPNQAGQQPPYPQNIQPGQPQQYPQPGQPVQQPPQYQQQPGQPQQSQQYIQPGQQPLQQYVQPGQPQQVNSQTVQPVQSQQQQQPGGQTVVQPGAPPQPVSTVPQTQAPSTTGPLNQLPGQGQSQTAPSAQKIYPQPQQSQPAMPGQPQQYPQPTITGQSQQPQYSQPGQPGQQQPGKLGQPQQQQYPQPVQSQSQQQQYPQPVQSQQQYPQPIQSQQQYPQPVQPQQQQYPQPVQSQQQQYPQPGKPGQQQQQYVQPGQQPVYPQPGQQQPPYGTPGKPGQQVGGVQTMAPANASTGANTNVPGMVNMGTQPIGTPSGPRIPPPPLPPPPPQAEPGPAQPPQAQTPGRYDPGNVNGPRQPPGTVYQQNRGPVPPAPPPTQGSSNSVPMRRRSKVGVPNMGQQQTGAPPPTQGQNSGIQSTTDGTRTGSPLTAPPTPNTYNKTLKSLEKRVNQMSGVLDNLYKLPDNLTLLDHPEGMNVNDMWQIIQLNNRVAATEAAIQRLASLIEELAKQMRERKGSEMSVQALLGDSAKKSELDRLRADLQNLKDQLSHGLKAAGVDPKKGLPSFLKDGQKEHQLVGADGKPLIDPRTGKAYKTEDVLTDKQGNPILGPDGKPILKSNIDGELLKDAAGNILFGPDGRPLTTNTPILDQNGQVKLDKDGNPITANSVITDKNGRPILGPNGEPLRYGDVELDAHGNPILGPDGKPILKRAPGMGNIELDKNGDPLYRSAGDVILGPDGKPLLGPDGKPLRNALGQLAVSNEGQPIKGPDGNPIYSNLGLLLLDDKKQIVKDDTGKMLYRNIGQLQYGPDLRPMLDQKNKPIYSNQGPILLDKDGKTPLLGSDKKPLTLQSAAPPLGEPIIGPTGENILGADGQPLRHNQVVHGPDGKVIFKDGKPILVTSPKGKGQIVVDENGQPKFGADGEPQYSVEGVAILGPNGKPLLGPDNRPLFSNIGQVILKSDGKPLVGPTGPVYANLGQIITDQQGKPKLGPDGKILYANVAQIMVDENGRPIYSKEGVPLYTRQNMPILDSSGRPMAPFGGPRSVSVDATQSTRSSLVGTEVGKKSFGQEVTQMNRDETVGAGADTANQGTQSATGVTASKGTDANDLKGLGAATDSSTNTERDDSKVGGVWPGNIGGGPTPVAITDQELVPDVDSSPAEGILKDELRRSWSEIHGMQRQLASDIQDKMEFIYQKLMREIANQQMTTSPYMAIGPGLGKCLGPGICTGHGMPAGTAVCQFPAMDEKARLTAAYRGQSIMEACPFCRGTGQTPTGCCSHCMGTGHAKASLSASQGKDVCPHCQGLGHVGLTDTCAGCTHGVEKSVPCPHCGGLGKLSGKGLSGPCAGMKGSGFGGPCPHGLEEYKVCPGPGICPGVAVCPTCKDDALHSLRAPTNQGLDRPLDPKAGDDKLDSNDLQMLDLLKKECKTLILLPKDLEELRERVKAAGKIPNVFDEMDILERLHTLWEAVNSLKHNDEALAVRMIKQDSALKKIPRGAIMEKIQKIPPENLDAIASASPDRPMIIPSVASLGGAGSGEEDDCNLLSGGGKKGSGVAEDDIQTIFNNLSNLLVESAAQKERLEGVSELIKNMEQTMVTKHMLIDAMSDKADKGQMNTKVSYDEFGNSMDELTTRMQNLLIEVYQKNENWKNITDHLGEELSAKLDKVELAPVRAYFKSHLKALEERVNYLTAQLEEPDPAGTRKKLLKDYNCISCDRHAHISGLTNSPQLPTLGPILAGHTTASQRAYDLHRMRQQKICKFEAEGRDMNLVSKELCKGGGRGSSTFETVGQSLNESDVINMVNRYVGGSHTSVSAGDRIAAMHKRHMSKAGEIPGESGGSPPPGPLKDGVGGGGQGEGRSFNQPQNNNKMYNSQYDE